MPNLDIDFVRSQFPAFKEPSLEGWAFFENAGGSYTCQQVIDRLFTFYHKLKVQPYYSFPASSKGGEMMDDSYKRLAAYLNVGIDEVHLGPSTTQNIYVLANALRSIWKEGDEIIVSNQDHEANAGAWRKLESTGIVVKEWHIDEESGRLSLDELDRLMTSKTKMIAYPHCSNVVAHYNPVKEISAKARAAGAITVVDGVSYAPHGLPDVAGLGADIYLFSLYKTWGPHLGLMTIKRELHDRMENQGHFFNEGVVHYTMTPAGPDHAQIGAAGGIGEYLDSIYEHHFSDDVDSAEKGRRVHDLFDQHETDLLATLLNWLKQRDDISIVGPDDAKIRTSTVSIIPKRKSIDELLPLFELEKLMVGYGHFYGARPLMGMKIPLETGVIRLSFIHYTNEAEIQQLINGMEKILD